MNTRRSFQMVIGLPTMFCFLGILLAQALLAQVIEREWVSAYDTSAYAEEFREVEVDGEGNAYVVGWPGLFKFNSDGEIVWRVEGNHYGLAVDADGSSYTSLGAMLRKYDSNGNLLWERNDTAALFGAVAGLWYTELSLDSNGGLYAIARAGNSTFLLQRYAADGNLLWQERGDPTNPTQYPAGMAAMPKGGVAAAYVCPNYNSEGVWAPFYRVLVRDPDGGYVLERDVPGSYNGPGGQLAADSAGNVFLFHLSGVTKISVSGEELTVSAFIPSYRPRVITDAADNVILSFRNSENGAWLVQLDNELNVQWQANLDDPDGNYQGTPMDLAVDPSGVVYLAGYRTPGTPRVMTWVYSGDGEQLFRDTTGGLYYAYGTSIALAGASFYVSAYTWYNLNAAYGGALIKYRPANSPPLADAGPNQVVQAIYADGSTLVQLDGGASYDPDGDPLSFEWADQDGVVFSTEPSPAVLLSEGSHVIQLKVNDGTFSALDTVQVTVEATPQGVGEIVEDLTKEGLIDPATSEDLVTLMDNATEEIAAGQKDKAAQTLDQFKHKVDKERDKENMTQEAAEMLLGAADATIKDLQKK